MEGTTPGRHPRARLSIKRIAPDGKRRDPQERGAYNRERGTSEA
jgi:hypothetical protein